MAKTASFGALHIVIAFSVGYAFTGSLMAAGALTLVEPACNMVAHYFFDRWWERREQRRGSARPGADQVPGNAPVPEGAGAATGLRPAWAGVVA